MRKKDDFCKKFDNIRVSPTSYQVTEKMERSMAAKTVELGLTWEVGVPASVEAQASRHAAKAYRSLRRP